MQSNESEVIDRAYAMVQEAEMAYKDREGEKTATKTGVHITVDGSEAGSLNGALPTGTETRGLLHGEQWGNQSSG
jgi:hypothetical protein